VLLPCLALCCLSGLGLLALLWRESCALELEKCVETVKIVESVEAVKYAESVEAVKYVESVGFGSDEELEGKLERSEPSLPCL